MNIPQLSKNPRAIKALLGLSWTEFCNLVPVFETSLYIIQKQKPNRKRAPGGGIKGILPTGQDKLFFILLYLKTYPTFDVLGFMTGKQRSHACEAVQLYSRVLEHALKIKLVLPERKIRSVEEFYKKFPEAKDIFVDGTERRVQRPSKPKNQTKTYSGKKKATTRKNVVISDEKKRILYLSPTKSGRRNDKRIVDKELLDFRIPEEVTIWADTGFQGLQHIHANIQMPTKGTKKKPLTPEQKSNNRIISSIRVAIENAICGIKRYDCVSDVFRNKLGKLDDLFMLLAAGLWNYHLQET